jgi:thymidylate synthase
MKGIEIINATTLGDAWFQAIYKVMGEGRRYLVDEGSYKGQYRSGISILINIHYPGARPLAPIMPEGSNIPQPTTDEKIEEYAAKYVFGLQEKQPNEHYTYAEDLSWVHKWVVKHYKEKGFGNNHGYMTVGRPETVFFYDDKVDYRESIIVMGRNEGEDILKRKISNEWNLDPENEKSSQCLRGIDTWIEENRLHFWVYFRSWELWAGFPENLGGFQLLKEEMARQIGVQDGIMIVSSKDLHIYEHTWAVALMRLGKKEKEV